MIRQARAADKDACDGGGGGARVINEALFDVIQFTGRCVL
jgi:hypothetical protein